MSFGRACFLARILFALRDTLLGKLVPSKLQVGQRGCKQYFPRSATVLQRSAEDLSALAFSGHSQEINGDSENDSAKHTECGPAATLIDHGIGQQQNRGHDEQGRHHRIERYPERRVVRASFSKRKY